MISISKTNWLDFILQRRWLAHLLFWSSFVFVFTIFATLNSGQLFPELIKYLAMLPAYWLATYSLVYFIGPRYLSTRRYVVFLGIFLLWAYLACSIGRWCIVHLAEPFFRADFIQETFVEILADPFYLLAVYFPAIYLIVFIFFAIKNVKDRLLEQHHLEILRKEKVETELQFLKTQIHPHFLFNTLNNLYSLTQEQSPKAPEVVLKLSEILDHMLYRSKSDEVPLAQELQLIQNYLDLESLRFGDKLTVNFAQDLEHSTWKIAPLVLLSLVENAFKHGVRKGIGESWVTISTTDSDQQFQFQVANSKPTVSTRNKSIHDGIGSNNIQRQLDLLYGNRHQLIVDETERSYKVTLTIETP